MSHPLCSKDIRWRLFGEVHMLSHLVGSSRRSDLGRLHDLEVAYAAADGQLAQLKHDHRAALKDRRQVDEEAERLRRELDRSNQRLIIARNRIAALESQTIVNELAARVEMLEQQLRDAQAQTTAAESALTEADARFEQAHRTGELAAEQVRELVAENHALEAELATSMSDLPDSEVDQVADVGALQGKKILCVGGRSNLVQHYRTLVERRGGELVHHDGGVIGESLDAVMSTLASVDAVFCPIDCVSHAAYWKVKKACKHRAKRLVLLRSSGLSSFARAIQTIATAPSEADS